MKIDKKHRTPEWVGISAAFVCGVVTHLFGLVNVLHNYDDIAQQPRGYGAGITSGRWLLSILGDLADWFGGNYNLPVVNGLLFLVLIACSAGLMVSAFQIQSTKHAALVGMLFVVFPSAFSTLAFRYTAVYYGIGILLSVMAAWVLGRYPWGLLLSALCIAGSLGIYQAYVPITIGIFVLLLLKQALGGKTEFWALVRGGLHYCVAIILGLLFYFLFLKASLAVYGTELSSYQGVGEMGHIALQDLPGLVWEAFYCFCMLPLKDYCGLASMKLIKVVYLLLCGASVLIIGYLLLRKIKKLSIILFVVILCLLFPIAVNFIVIMCPDSWIYTLMVYSFVLLGCVPVILLECFPKQEAATKTWQLVFGKGIRLLVAVLICCYAYQTNVNYTALHFSNRQVENYLNSLVVQVRMTEGFTTEKEWAFLGNIEDPLLNCYWQYEISYGGAEFTQGMLQRYSIGDWISNYYGYIFPVAEDTKIADLRQREAVRNMPCWPDEGSIKIIEDTVVVKFQEE